MNSELRARILAYNAAKQAAAAERESLEAIGIALLTMWDALSGLSKAAVTKALPNLSAKLTELRSILTEEKP